MNKEIVAEIYKHIKDGKESQDLIHHLRRFSAHIDIIGKEIEEEKLQESDYHYFNHPILLRERGVSKPIECCCLLNQKFFSVFDLHMLYLRIPIKEMVGVHPISKRFPERNICGMFLACVNISSKRLFKFEFETKDEQIEGDLVKLVQQISFLGEIRKEYELINSKNRRLMVIINPVSGAKKSVKIFERDVKPIFDLCHFTYDTIITKKMGHGVELMRIFDPEKYTEIVSVGGDGMLYEIVQGLFQHPRLAYQEIKNIPLSIIPCGTGNGISWCMGSSISPVLASLITARGRTVPYDVFSVITPQERLYSFLFFSYGVGPDVDLGYKSIKWMGDVKYVIAGALSCVKRTRYPLEMKYVMLEGETQTPQDPYIFPTHFGNAFQRRRNPVRLLANEEDKRDPPLTFLERHFGEDLQEMLANHKKKKSEEEETEGEDDLSESIILEDSENYRDVKTVVKTITEDTMLMTVANARKFSVDFWGAGRAQPGNGYVDLIWCEKLGMMKAFSVLAKMVGKEPDYLDDPHMTSARIKAFYFTPKGPKFSLLDIDGEEKDVQPAMGMVHQGLLSVCHLETPW